MFTSPIMPKQIKQGRETIHSGHFMVSHFEAEEQDDEDEVAVPVPEVPSPATTITTIVPVKQFCTGVKDVLKVSQVQQHLSIDTSLSKLFQCMTLAYRQKLTSPKWNRFRGIRLRWKDKIRLNNVIWRCWHMQFVKKENTLICQFASPLDVDTHNKPEAVVLEGKYWKRKLHAVTAEYKKWRMFYRHHALGQIMLKDNIEMLNDLAWAQSPSNENLHMMVDEDYMGLMSDTLFSTITNQPFHFPDSREIAKAGLADFIQPSLGPLQPNLDDYMDTFEPLQAYFTDFMTSKLPTVPEEQSDFKALNWGYSDLDLMGTPQSPYQYYPVNSTSTSNPVPQYTQMQPVSLGKQQQSVQNLPSSSQSVQRPNFINQMILPSPQTETVDQYVQQNAQALQQVPMPPPMPPQSPPTYQRPQTSGVIGKSKTILKGSQDQVAKTYGNNLTRVYPSQQVFQAQGGNISQLNVIAGNSRIVTVPDQNQQQSTITRPSAQHLSFKLPQQSIQEQRQQGYKFPPPGQRANIKFTSQSNSKEEEIVKPTRPRGRPRSKSTSRETIKPRPPLLSAASDPSLLTPANSVLLTQLLANNNKQYTTDQQIMAPNNSVLLTQLLTNNSTSTESINVYQNQNLGGSHEHLAGQLRIKEENNLTSRIVPNTTTLIITSPVNLNTMQQSPLSDSLGITCYSNSNSPILETASQCLNSPTSSQGSIGSPNPENHRDRRVGHIHAEQKRRYNIKNGFDMLHSLIPQLSQNPNAKLSKAAMLQKGAEYIKQLRTEREQLKEEMSGLRQQIDTLNTSISNCQSMLPATVTPSPITVTRRDGKMEELFDEYVRNRTMENWKFWIFSLMFRPLLVSFNNVVSTSSLDDLYRSTILWVEQHCTLGDLRPVVFNSLRYLCTKTEILTEPEKLPDEARQISLSNK